MRKQRRENAAKVAAREIRERFNIKTDVDTAIVLGTGWGDAFENKGFSEMHLRDIPRLTHVDQYDQIHGHDRTILFGIFGGKNILALKGRLHLNESLFDHKLYKMARLQIEMLFHLGVRNLIVTSAVGSLRDYVKVGNVCAVDSFLTAFAPPMPLWGGEFCSPEDVLAKNLIALAMEKIHKLGLAEKHFKSVTHVMVRGPFFEGREKDKAFFASCGADVIGMSLLPEASIASLYREEGVKVLGLCFVTNTAIEDHSHEENQKRAKESSESLTHLLDEIVREL